MVHTFQQTAIILIVIWLLLVVVRFRRSTSVLLGGLLLVGMYTLSCLVLGKVTPAELGLAHPQAWLHTLAFSLAGLGIMVAVSPLADRLASRWFSRPPALEAFRPLQQSPVNLLLGIVTAWVLGGFLEELIARGIVLNTLKTVLDPRIGPSMAIVLAVLTAAAGAGAMHLYQGPRAAAIITMLSVLFGVLFIASGTDLWAVILCHGLYDTIAFIRFAGKKSKYANLDPV